MSQSTDMIDREDELWWKERRFYGVSEEELQRIKEQDEQRKAAEEDVNRIIEDGLKDPERNFETKETEAARERKRQEKLKEIYSD